MSHVGECAEPKRLRYVEDASSYSRNSVKKSMTVIVSYLGDISVVILIRTDTTLDHSQKAEKVCPRHVASTTYADKLNR